MVLGKWHFSPNKTRELKRCPLNSPGKLPATQTPPPLRHGSLVAALEKSKNRYKIKTPDPGKANSCRPDNRNTTIFFDPYEDQGPEGKKRPPVVGLVHELQHSSDFDQGIIDVETNPKTGVEKSEEKA